MRFLGLKLSHKVLILVTVPIVLMVGFVATLSYLKKQAEEEIWRERHAKTVISECNSLMQDFVNAELLLLLFEDTRQQTYLSRFKSICAGIPIKLHSLKLLLSDGPHNEASIEHLIRAGDLVNGLLHNADAMIDRNIARVRNSSVTQAEFVKASSQMLDCLQGLVYEQKRIESQYPQNEARARFLIDQLLYSGVALSIVIAFLLAVFFNRSTTSRLSVLLQNTNKLAAGQELNPQLSGTDEIARLDEVFHEMARTLAETASRKQELVQMVTHDLRTPLMTIDSTLHVVLSGPAGNLDEAVANKITRCKRNANRLLELINDLLDIERLETGEFPIDKQEVEVGKLFESSSEAVSAFAAERSVAITSKHVDISIYADPARIEQVLINLISNAVKFSPAGTTVELECSELADEVELRVVDHGRGVPPEFQSAIFQRFGQVKTEDAAHGKGTGLGLPICKALVEAHQGSIGVRSEAGEGSIFWFRLPKVRTREICHFE